MWVVSIQAVIMCGLRWWLNWMSVWPGHNGLLRFAKGLNEFNESKLSFFYFYVGTTPSYYRSCMGKPC